MNYKTIHNPEDKEITLKYKGEVFSIGAKQDKEFAEDVAAQWIYIYGFMSYAEPKKVLKEEEKPKKK